MTKFMLSLLALLRWRGGGLGAWGAFFRQAALLPLLLPLLLFAGAKIYLHQSTLVAIDTLVATLPSGVKFQFEQIDSHFNGLVDLQGATLLLDGMSLPVQFQTLQLDRGNWRELPAIRRGLEQSLLPSSFGLQFSLAENELGRLSTASMLPIAAARMLLGCIGSEQRLNASNGEPFTVFKGRFDTRFDPQSEYLSARLQLGADQRYQLNIDADLDIGASKLSLAALSAAGLGGAELSYLNQGAQSVLLRNCGAIHESGLVEGAYVAKQSQQLKQRLSTHGWITSTELELAYQDYLFLPLQLRVQLTAAQPVNVAELVGGVASWGSFSVRIGLNRPQADQRGLAWSSAITASQPTASVETTDASVLGDAVAANLLRSNPALSETAELESYQTEVAPRLSPISDAALEKELQKEQLQAVSYKPSFKSVSVTQLSGLLGAPMRLTTTNGRRMEGVLERVEFDRLQLRSEMSQGIAILPVRLDIISAMQAYF